MVTFIYDFIKKELSGWKCPEIVGLLTIFGVILYNALILHDSIISVISATCGILYTIIAGKGKISCYLFGLTGSVFYGYLAFKNAIWGNLFLYVGYYIPMQIIGIIHWKNNLNKKTNEIYKTKLSHTQRIQLFSTSLFLCTITYIILLKFNDSHPIADSLTTVLSVMGMYLTVKRCIEQWLIWTVVNAISVIMWIMVIQSGERAYSTVIMWSVYLVLGIYFYSQWRKEVS